MRLLLDTYIWLWSLGEPVRLRARVRRELRDRTNELWLSPVSTWEALLLNAKGRIRILAHRLPLPHPDPADRFLAATAQVLGLTLVTGDERLLGLGEIRTLANR